MNSWVLSSNPATYDAKQAFSDSDEIDWVSNQKFEVGDTVFIYEVMPPRGRGGIVYKTKVTKINISLDSKLEDIKHWAGQAYPKNMNELTRFTRLGLIKESSGNSLSLNTLKAYGFTPPQGLAHILDKKPRLLNYIEAEFNR